MKTVFIINPKSGNGDRAGIERQIRERFGDADMQILHTEWPGHATELAHEAVARGAELVVAVGGDGTVNEVLNGLIGTDARLGVIPVGTANDLARHHGLPSDVGDACEIIRAGRVRRTDVVKVNGRCFLTVGGLGLPCDTVSATESLRRKAPLGRLLPRALGSGIYLPALLRAVMRNHRGRQVRIRAGNVRLRSNALSVTLGNQPMLGRYFRISPGARTDDGLLDVCVIDAGNLMRFFAILALVLMGRHVRMRGVTTMRAGRATIHTSTPMTFFGDGQFIDTADRFDVSVLPGAVSLIVPSGDGG